LRRLSTSAGATLSALSAGPDVSWTAGSDASWTTGSETTGTAGSESTGAKAARPTGPTVLAAAVVHPAAAVVHLAAAIAVMAPVTPMVPAAHTRAEDEAGAEDDGNDEYGTRNDADPRGRDVQLAASGTLFDVMRLHDGRLRRGATDGTGDGFW
jgi:hypothetical protein